MEGQTPLDLLRGLEIRALARARGLPMQAEVREQWRGLAFTLAGVPLLAPIDQVEEIVTVPAMTRVPLTKRWVLGLANVRGNLLPVMDLAGYLGLESRHVDAASRVLVIRDGEFFAGLLVDGVAGLVHVDVDERSDTAPVGVSELQDYLSEGYRLEGEIRPVFDFRKLTADGGFMQAAA